MKKQVQSKQGSPAVFLDRDGIINVDRGYAYRPEDVELIPDAAACILRLKKLGFVLPVITNQSGVARGFYSFYDVLSFNQYLSFALKKRISMSVDAFYICPHFVGGIIPEYSKPCLCRKPETALVELAMKEFHLDRGRCFFIGDKDSDIHCAHNAGLQPIFLQTAQISLEKVDRTVVQVQSFTEAVDYIEKS